MDLTMHLKTIAIVPARGGSKSVKLKNLAPLAGRPLIDHCLSTCVSCSQIDGVFVSTEYDMIAEHCREFGVEVWSRPDCLAADHVATLDVLLFHLREFQKANAPLPEFIVLVEPTSPFLRSSDVEGCLELLQDDHFDSAQTVITVPPNLHAFNQRIIDEGCSVFCYPEDRKGKSGKQDKGKRYAHGNVRVIRSSTLLKKESIFGRNSAAMVIERKYGFDVDGPEDFEMAEAMLAATIL